MVARLAGAWRLSVLRHPVRGDCFMEADCGWRLDHVSEEPHLLDLESFKN